MGYILFKKKLRNKISHMQIKINKIKINHTKEKQNIHAHQQSRPSPNQECHSKTNYRKRRFGGRYTILRR